MSFADLRYTYIMRLNREFYNRPTITVARQLLGKCLCRRINGKVVRAKITETEAYCGTQDLACHASKGLTPRTKVMFGPPGHAYVYMIYGMYHCLNIVTREEGCPEAVLIRGAEIINPKSKILNPKQSPKIKNPKLTPNIYNLKPILNGPGILCRELKIDKRLNNADLIKSKELWVEDNGEISKNIKKGKRKGVDYAGKWKDKLWRLYISG